MVQSDSGERMLSSDLLGKERYLKMSFDTPLTVQPDEVGNFPVLLFRGTLSHATSVTMQFCIQSMEAKPRYKTLKLRSKIPGDGITMVLG